MMLPVWTDKQIFEQMNKGGVWGNSVITYAFMQQWSNRIDAHVEVNPSAFLPILAPQEPFLNLSMQLWDDLISSTIQQGSTHTANMLIGNVATTDDYAFAYYPFVGGSIWFSHDDESEGTATDLQNPTVGDYNFMTMVHEIGHALGLGHMGNYNGEYDDGASSYQDSHIYSIMSYYGPARNVGEGQVAWGDWVDLNGKVYSAQTPMLNDIMVIQSKYGADATTRADNTVYGFNSTIEGHTAQIYDFSLNQHPVLTIYDAGGVDTLDLSGWDTNSSVDLRPGEFTSGNSMTKNIAIAYNTIIENAITGAGNDTLRGNSANNYLDGGDGLDTVIFSGDFADLNLKYDVFNREYTVWDNFFGPESNGTDTLINIERAIFDDFSGALHDLTSSVYRFYNPELGTYFYTANNDEASVVAQMDSYQYEGAVYGRNINDTNTVSVHRLLNNETGEHFFTADEAELYALREASDTWLYEGTAFNAYTEETDGTYGLYRFINNETGMHYYTISPLEGETITLSGNFSYEGIAFYVDM